MVLHHVAQRARRLVVAAAAFDADRLGHRDLHVVDVAAVPDRLEDAVGEAEDHQVLDGLLAQVVIDAVDLRLAEGRGQFLVQGTGGGDVAAERLLDDDPPPRRIVRSRDGALVEARAAEALGDLAEQGRWHRQVEQRVAEGEAIELRPQALVGGWIVEVAEDQGKMRVEPAALVGRELAVRGSGWRRRGARRGSPSPRRRAAPSPRRAWRP